MDRSAPTDPEQLTRCVVCGNKWRWCTCGSQSPLDCDACKRGKGKGDNIDRYVNGKPVRGDRLCPKHAAIGGRQVLNREERRRAAKRSKGRR